MTENTKRKEMIKLVSIELENFKSFSNMSGKSQNLKRVPHLIGPFSSVTGIIGGNGLGKSNIFDAISFGLDLNISR
jgi:chromosome segregation ATPase